jgi:hypothetical protein
VRRYAKLVPWTLGSIVAGGMPVSSLSVLYLQKTPNLVNFSYI